MFFQTGVRETLREKCVDLAAFTDIRILESSHLLECGMPVDVGVTDEFLKKAKCIHWV